MQEKLNELAYDASTAKLNYALRCTVRAARFCARACVCVCDVVHAVDGSRSFKQRIVAGCIHETECMLCLLLYVQADGLSVEVSGFSHKLPTLLESVVDMMFKLEVCDCCAALAAAPVLFVPRKKSAATSP